MNKAKAGVNIIKNGDFADGTNAWKALVPDRFHVENYERRNAAAFSVNPVSFIRQNTGARVIEGERYRISARVAAVLPEGMASPTITVVMSLVAGGHELAQGVQIEEASPDWIYHEAEFTIGYEHSGSIANVQINVISNSDRPHPGSWRYYITDVSLVRV